MRNYNNRLLMPLILVLLLSGCGEETGEGPVALPTPDPPDPPSVTLTHPVGGELVVDTVTVQWEATDPDPGETPLLTVDLQYRHSELLAWREIATGLETTDSFLWNVTSLEERLDYRLRIIVTDTTGRYDSDSTGAYLRIVRRIFINDQGGHVWDITHAVYNYGMAKENWRGGGGTGAIQPINNPEILSPGDPGYPSDTATHLVVGTVVGGDVRAYALEDLMGREVVNDIVGGEHIAVIY